MKTTAAQYKKMNEKASPNSPMAKNMLFAFLIGGAICALGEGLFHLYVTLDLSIELAYAAVSVSLVLLSAILTGLKVYDRIARYGGAGTLVPITGFANSVVSSAMEFKSEGLVLGLGVKMFIIAGPVIVYGTVASVVYGMIYWLILQA